MSYDVWLAVDTGGPHLARVTETWNYTTNCAPMWRAAGADLAEFEGKTAGECAPILAAAIERMRSDPAPYVAMNPENGWGSYETLLPRLEVLLGEFNAHPKAIVEVSR